MPAFIKIGLVPDSGGTLAHRLARRRRVLGVAHRPRRLSAEEARDWGLVSEVVAVDQLAERGHEVAQLFAAMPTRAVWHTKRLLDAAETTTFAEQLELEAAAQAELTQTWDFREGVSAFLEKRDSRFIGADVLATHPIRMVVTDDLDRWRLTVATRWLLVLPHLLVLTLWTYLAVLVGVVNWAITLARGESPRGVHNWMARLVRYQAHVYAYLFTSWGRGPLPVVPRLARHLSRRSRDRPAGTAGALEDTGLRWARIDPRPAAYLLATVLTCVALSSLPRRALRARRWGATRAGSKRPQRVRFRYQGQMFGFLLLLTDRYPALASGSGFTHVRRQG